MSIRFECVSCNKNIVVHDRFEGRNVRCPACSIELVVPKKSQIAEQLEKSSSTAPSKDQPKQNTKSDPRAVPVIPVTESDTSWVQSLGELETKEVVSAKKSRRSRSIRGDHDEEEEDLEWDITPMVDVAFLLLIFFMLTASFSIQKVIRTAPPQSDAPSNNAVQVPADDKGESITIQVDEFNAYTVVTSDGQTNDASSKQELIGILKDIRSQAGEHPPRVIIQAHVDSFHGATVGCMDAAREADFSSFQLYAVESFD